MASSHATPTRRGSRRRTARAAPASCENPTRSKPPDGATANFDGQSRAPKLCRQQPRRCRDRRPVRENVRRGRSGDRERRRVRMAEQGEMSLPRRAGPRRVRREDSRERKHGLASRSRDGPRAPWGGATGHEDTLAIADEAAASGRGLPFVLLEQRPLVGTRGAPTNTPLSLAEKSERRLAVQTWWT
jgi:hypothetical protein